MVSLPWGFVARALSAYPWGDPSEKEGFRVFKIATDNRFIKMGIRGLKNKELKRGWYRSRHKSNMLALRRYVRGFLERSQLVLWRLAG